MKKILILSTAILILTPLTVFSAPQLDKILSDKISEYGIFDGNEGIVFADTKRFQENDSLFIVTASTSELECQVYDDTDGMQLTDKITFPLNNGNFQLISAVKHSSDCIVLSKSENGKMSQECYMLINDAFSQVEPSGISGAAVIVEVRNGKVTSYPSSENIHRFLNRLKEYTIASYSLPNKINMISDEDISAIKRTVTSCADIMRFDIKNYDYDTLFKYILYTHQNFRLLTDIDPQSGNSSSFGYNNVSLVSSEFIDYVIENVFRLTPQKPPVNNLLSRGFCYSNGYYFYTGGFDAYFSTQVLDIKGVYELGGGVYYVVFSDIYTENGVSKPEYSFAIMQKNDDGYSLLRLGMGEDLPSQSEIRLYSPFSVYNNRWWGNAETSSKSRITLPERFLMPILLVIISVGIVGFICSVIILIKGKK